MKSKRGQEEIVGFVMIIIIVAVGLLVFLTFSLRQEPEGREKTDVRQFLEAAMEYTTDCKISSGADFASLKEVLIACNNDIRCNDGVETCDILNESVNTIVEEGWNIGSDTPVRGYKWASIYVTNNTQNGFFEISKGICVGRIDGAEYLSSSYPGKIRTALELCY